MHMKVVKKYISMTQETMKIAKNLTLTMKLGTESVTEKNEIRAVCVMDAVNPGSYVAMYLSPDSYVFLCQVIDVGVAP